ncbi:MAG: YajQ family cyclic di-GMP-binding protein [Thiotrichales bacterium]|jgi:hypothetical protein|nr:YajQ family cyclic di-GMP-binding protein [Thiotrichales bacterium]
MPSFDIVSEVDKHELANAVDQANKEVTSRFDFKGTDSSFSLDDKEMLIKLQTESEFQLDQMYDILTAKLIKRGIDTRSIERKNPDIQLKTAKQTIIVHQGLDATIAKKITKAIKDQKMKVQAAIQGETVRVTGKKRDDLQEAIAMLRQLDDLERPLQFNNFRD